jgi:hypothetical protein
MGGPEVALIRSADPPSVIYSLDAWEIDAGVVYLSVNLAHRLACRAFLRRPNHRTGRVLELTRRIVNALDQITLSRFLARSICPRSIA